jgi:hypothetical protein
MNARNIIKKAYGNSKNFMTPKLIRYGKINSRLAYELSYGDGIIENTVIFGVSVASMDPEEKNAKMEFELSKCYHSIQEAEHYIKDLKDKQNGDKTTKAL